MMLKSLRFILPLALLFGILLASPATWATPPAPAGPIPNGYLWDSDADFAPGAFYNTRVVSGTGSVTLAQTPVWSPNVRVNNVPFGYQDYPSLAVGPDGTLYAAWRDYHDGANISSARSTDGGATWSASVRVDDAQSSGQRGPSLVVGADGTLYAAWDDYRNGNADIYSARSTDGGATWSANVRVNNAPFGYQDSPSLAVGPDGTLYAAWEDYYNGNADIYSAYSTDGGATWNADVRVDDATPGGQYNPSLAVGPDGTLYAAWQDSRNGDYDIYLAHSTDGGATWSVNVRVDDATSGWKEFPSLAVGPDGTIYTVWQDSRNGNYDIYLARSTDGGATWSANVRVNDVLSGHQFLPSLAAGLDGTLYAAWEDERNGSGYDIYTARSTDGGATWSANIRADDAPSGGQYNPSLAVGPDGLLCAAWANSRDGDYDIYSARWLERSGAYIAAPADAGAFVSWGTLAYTATLPAGTGVAVSARVGNSPMPDARWSSWVTLGGSPADLSALPAARYFQWKADLTTPVSTTTPVLEAVRLTWGDSCTNVGGVLSSNATWSVANSPYCVASNVLVSPGVTLTVEPGVTVYISDTCLIQVQGTLVALGTEAQPIRLTSWWPGGRRDDWGGITFADTAVGATFDAQGNYLGGGAFRYVTVEYAGYGSQSYAIDAPNTALYLDHCTVRSNGAGGARIGSSSRVLNNAFSANSASSGGGVYSSGSGVIISGNTFSANSASLYGGGMYNSGSNATISGNTFLTNRATAGGGVDTGGNNVTISGNTFYGNSAYDYGGAIRWSGSGGILYNTITNNTSSGGVGGIYLNSGFAVIQHNALVGNQGYALRNNNGGTTHVDARYNWWGTTDDGTIQGLIYDWFDDSDKSIVDYAPYLTRLAADLSTSSKTVAPAVAAPGETVTYTVQIFNQSPLTATLVYFTDTLPAHVTYVPDSAQGASYSGGTLTWQGSIRPGETRVITFAATVNASAPLGVVTNIACISGDGMSGTLTLEAAFTVPLQAGVAFAPDHRATARPGEVLTFTHTLTNTGNIADVFDLTVGNDGGWVVELGGLYPGGTAHLPWPMGAGVTATIVVSVTTPADVVSRTVNTTVITATSRFSPTVWATVRDVISVYVEPLPRYTVYLPLVLRQ